MGPFLDFYGAIMGLTSAKSVNLWSILSLLMFAVFTYISINLSTIVLTFYVSGLPNGDFFVGT